MSAQEKISFFLRLSWWITVDVRFTTYEKSSDEMVKILSVSNDLLHKISSYTVAINILGKTSHSAQDFIEMIVKDGESVNLNIRYLIQKILNNEFSSEGKCLLLK